MLTACVGRSGELEIKLSAAQQSVAESKETADKALVDRLVMEKERATLEKSIADLQSAAARADKDAKEYQVPAARGSGREAEGWGE